MTSHGEGTETGAVQLTLSVHSNRIAGTECIVLSETSQEWFLASLEYSLIPA